MTEQSKMPARIWAEDTRDYGAWFERKRDEYPVEYVRADIAEQMAEALRDALRSSRKDFRAGPIGDQQHRNAYAEQFAALSAWEASKGNQRTATDDEIVEMTSREAALGPEETGND